MKAGWPQQVCERGKRTSTPNRSRTATVEKHTPGKKVSAMQVENRDAERFGAIGKVYVITSYSIHYTKLYEVTWRRKKTKKQSGQKAEW